MLNKLGFSIGQLFNDPRARAIIIITSLILAALAGGAPSDHGG